MTDEQFKGLASETDETKQDTAATEVLEARKSGDKAEARMKAREIQAAAKPVKETKAAKATKETKDDKGAASKPVVKPAVAGPQAELPAVAAPAKKKLLQAFVVEEMAALAKKRAPVHDYVRGVFDALEYVLGDKELASFAKPWHQYIDRLNGKAKAAKPERAKKIAKVAKKRAAKAKK